MHGRDGRQKFRRRLPGRMAWFSNCQKRLSASVKGACRIDVELVEEV